MRDGKKDLTWSGDRGSVAGMNEIVFEVREDEVDGGFTASAVGAGIHTQGDTAEELRRNIREAVETFFDETMICPRTIRLQFVRNEVLAA